MRAVLWGCSRPGLQKPWGCAVIRVATSRESAARVATAPRSLPVVLRAQGTLKTAQNSAQDCQLEARTGTTCVRGHYQPHHALSRRSSVPSALRGYKRPPTFEPSGLSSVPTLSHSTLVAVVVAVALKVCISPGLLSPVVCFSFPFPLHVHRPSGGLNLCQFCLNPKPPAATCENSCRSVF